jgi:hypothetical protein
LLQEAFATQLALFCSELQVMVAEAIRSLRVEAWSCRVCLEHAAGLDATPHADFVDEGKADLYGCFSPRACLGTPSLPFASMSEATKVSTPVLQIMPKLQELHEESSVVPLMELG